MKKIFSYDYWVNHPYLHRLTDWAKRTSFIGLQGVPVYHIIKFIYKEALTDNISTRANSMTFSFFLALFPSIIFIFTLLPYIPTVSDYAINLQDALEGIIPPTGQKFLFEMIDDIVSRQRSGLLSFGLVLALFFASNGIMSMMYGFEKLNVDTFVQRSWIRKRIVAIFLTVVISSVFILSSLLIVLGHVGIDFLVNYTNLNQYSIVVFSILRWIIVIFVIYFSISMIYRYGPSTTKRWKLFSTGSSVATISIVVVSVAFSYFVTNFGRYNELYGSLGALIVLLLWLNIICMIILIGFELNASIAVNKHLLFEKEDQ